MENKPPAMVGVLQEVHKAQNPGKDLVLSCIYCHIRATQRDALIKTKQLFV